jgi:hypothetical protein
MPSPNVSAPVHRRSDRTLDDVRLVPWQRWGMLAVLTGVFLFGGSRPVWHNPFDIDLAIWLSYAPIPILVAAGLLWSRRLSLGTWLLNTLEIVMLKFAITYVIAITLWATFPRPDAPEPLREAPARPAATPPPVTPWPAAKRGGITGSVSREGAAIEGALVMVTGGLEDIVSERPATPVELLVDAGQLGEPLQVVQRWQPLVGRSGDGRLHPLRFEREQDVLLTTPVLASGETRAIPTHGLDGLMAVRCTLHGEATNLAVVPHPHHVRTDTDGRFELAGVPALGVEVRAWHDGRWSEPVNVDVAPEEDADVALEL